MTDDNHWRPFVDPADVTKRSDCPLGEWLWFRDRNGVSVLGCRNYLGWQFDEYMYGGDSFVMPPAEWKYIAEDGDE